MAEELNLATKVCKACGRTLPLSSFGVHNKSADGHMAVCNDCRHRKRLNTDNPLENFTARQLMCELRARGYRGTLEYTEVHHINLSGL